MENGAAGRIRRRGAEKGPGRGMKKPVGRGKSILFQTLLFSVLIHGLILGTIWFYHPRTVRKVIDLYNITMAETPGPVVGGGGNVEEEKPKEKVKEEVKKEDKIPIEEPVKREKKVVEKKAPELPKKKEPEKLEAPPVVAKPLPVGPGQGPTGGGDKKAQVQGPVSIDGGKEFQYAWYLDALQKRVFRNWSPPAVAMKNVKQPIIHFSINRNGTVDGISLEQSSGNGQLDRSAMSAIAALKRLQDLPAGFKGDSLGVHYTFISESK